MIQWSSQKRRISELIPAKYNPRKMSDKDKEDITKSIDRFSLADPVIINSDNTVIGGHQRLKILKEKNVQEVDVRVPDRQLSVDEEKELNLRLNKNSGRWDDELLKEFSPEFLVDVGFDGGFVDSLHNTETVEDEFDADNAYKDIKEPITKFGDTYSLDGHRLMCGDSRNFSDVEKLMGGGKAGMVYTDPPYNVAYKSHQGKDWGNIKNDDMNDDDFVDWLSEIISNAYAFSDESVNMYCWFAMSNYTLFRQAIEKSGFRYMQTCFWLKDRFVISMGQCFHRITEPVMIFYKDWNKRYINKYYAKNSDMWELDRLTFEEYLDVMYVNKDKSKDYQHPTQKPVRLAERALKRTSEPGTIVLDLFAGSGSTLLCCEQIGRKSYNMEFDPKYCDVIIKRWEDFTGKKAVKLT